MAPPNVALVTGSSEGGIGFYLCQKLAERGFTVYATSRTLSSTAALVHPNIKKLPLDVTDDSQVQSVVASIIEESGQIDMLINNAGILAPGPTVDWKAEDVKTVYDTNVFSIIRLCGAVVPHMAKRRKGTIVNIGSIVGEFPTPWMGVYDSSKAAVRLLTEVLSMECKPFDIRVMLVAPGSIQSKIIEKHDHFQLAPNSIYGAFFHNIRQRLEAARDKLAMPADKFAEEIVTKALRPNPPSYVLTGGNSTLFRFLAFLPRRLYLSIIWGMFSKPEAKSKRD
ncbi:NAD-P-binding protein [Mycena venus]|uniref:NAD-P-binding protein n=1 Tax=Mycena venus TaxID=2733690 RepID=A0A8H6XPK8_9AGAR|nr:NAD-P-binding protein [Mycena venus]